MTRSSRPVTTKFYNVCRIPIAAVTPAAAATALVGLAKAGAGGEVHLCNAYTLSLVERDEVMRKALLRADLNLPDGVPVAWLGRAAGTKGPVRGPALVTAVACQGLDVGLRHYLYGGGPGVAEEMDRRMRERLPGVEIVAAESPPYGDIDDAAVEELADRVRSKGAQIVWVGLGTPKQDYFVPRLADRVNAVVVPVGAAFDFLAGAVREAPTALHGTGLEWLYRLSRDPRRLWRRYVFGNPRFVLNVVRSRRFCMQKTRTGTGPIPYVSVQPECEEA
jgi:N-acetylglucosaminyldiphosphoundecaprenol N-acetyl-beta-D-mannosaminyltransferase